MSDIDARRSDDAIILLDSEGGTGPARSRTETGKAISSQNATTHGIFAKAVILKGESAEERFDLLERFRRDLRSEGALEEMLVEKLATLSWRLRRLLTAEAGESETQQNFCRGIVRGNLKGTYKNNARGSSRPERRGQRRTNPRYRQSDYR